MAGINLDDSVMTTRLDSVVNWARKNSLWPLPFGTACCAIEFMSMMASRYDFSRFGAEALRFSPRQSDMLLVLGTVTNKQAPVLRQIYAQMAEPKWVVAVGVCASSGGMYRTYATLQGIDRVVPVDVYVPGCPPRPETMIYGVMELQKKISRETLMGAQGAHRAVLRVPGAPGGTAAGRGALLATRRCGRWCWRPARRAGSRSGERVWGLRAW